MKKSSRKRRGNGDEEQKEEEGGEEKTASPRRRLQRPLQEHESRSYSAERDTSESELNASSDTIGGMSTPSQVNTSLQEQVDTFNELLSSQRKVLGALDSSMPGSERDDDSLTHELEDLARSEEQLRRELSIFNSNVSVTSPATERPVRSISSAALQSVSVLGSTSPGVSSAAYAYDDNVRRNFDGDDLDDFSNDFYTPPVTPPSRTAQQQRLLPSMSSTPDSLLQLFEQQERASGASNGQADDDENTVEFSASSPDSSEHQSHIPSPGSATLAYAEELMQEQEEERERAKQLEQQQRAQEARRRQQQQQSVAGLDVLTVIGTTPPSPSQIYSSRSPSPLAGPTVHDLRARFAAVAARGAEGASRTEQNQHRQQRRPPRTPQSRIEESNISLPSLQHSPPSSTRRTRHSVPRPTAEEIMEFTQSQPAFYNPSESQRRSPTQSHAATTTTTTTTTSPSGIPPPRQYEVLSASLAGRDLPRPGYSTTRRSGDEKESGQGASIHLHHFDYTEPSDDLRITSLASGIISTSPLTGDFLSDSTASPSPVDGAPSFSSPASNRSSMRSTPPSPRTPDIDATDQPTPRKQVVSLASSSVKPAFFVQSSSPPPPRVADDTITTQPSLPNHDASVSTRSSSFTQPDARATAMQRKKNLQRFLLSQQSISQRSGTKRVRRELLDRDDQQRQQKLPATVNLTSLATGSVLEPVDSSSTSMVSPPRQKTKRASTLAVNVVEKTPSNKSRAAQDGSLAAMTPVLDHISPLRDDHEDDNQVRRSSKSPEEEAYDFQREEQAAHVFTVECDSLDAETDPQSLPISPPQPRRSGRSVWPPPTVSHVPWSSTSADESHEQPDIGLSFSGTIPSISGSEAHRSDGEDEEQQRFLLPPDTKDSSYGYDEEAESGMVSTNKLAAVTLATGAFGSGGKIVSSSPSRKSAPPDMPIHAAASGETVSPSAASIRDSTQRNAKEPSPSSATPRRRLCGPCLVLLLVCIAMTCIALPPAVVLSYLTKETTPLPLNNVSQSPSEGPSVVPSLEPFPTFAQLSERPSSYHRSIIPSSTPSLRPTSRPTATLRPTIRPSASSRPTITARPTKGMLSMTPSKGIPGPPINTVPIPPPLSPSPTPPKTIPPSGSTMRPSNNVSLVSPSVSPTILPMVHQPSSILPSASPGYIPAVAPSEGPTEAPTFLPTLRATMIFPSHSPAERTSSPTGLSNLFDFLQRISPDGGGALQNSSSPQYKAYQWLAGNSNLASYPAFRLRQRYSLATLYYSTNGDGWTTKTLWLSNENECLWFTRVGRQPVCGQDSLFQRLNLYYNNLFGTIPPELSLLSNSLESINLAGGPKRFLVGNVPTELGLLTNLQELQLQNNALIGPLRINLSLLTKLTTLDINNNVLSGTISNEIGLLTDLTYLDISQNSFLGQIPAQVGILTQLSYLDLHTNFFTGAIPPTLGLLTKLETLSMSGNKLTRLPAELGLLTNLTTLDLSNNYLSGPLTINFFTLGRLQALSMSQNALTGPLPESLTHLTNLRDGLDLSYNQFTGAIPSDIGNMDGYLRSLKLNNNKLSGTIPVSVAELTKINLLRLDRNNLVGSMPAAACVEFDKTLPIIFVDCLEVECPCCTYCCVDGKPCTCEYEGTLESWKCMLGNVYQTTSYSDRGSGT